MSATSIILLVIVLVAIIVVVAAWLYERASREVSLVPVSYTHLRAHET